MKRRYKKKRRWYVDKGKCKKYLIWEMDVGGSLSPLSTHTQHVIIVEKPLISIWWEENW